MRSMQRLGRNRLAEELVHAEPHRLHHALALHMAGQHDDGNMRAPRMSAGERTMRMNSAPLMFGISQSRMTMSGLSVMIASSPSTPSCAS